MSADKKPWSHLFLSLDCLLFFFPLFFLSRDTQLKWNHSISFHCGYANILKSYLHIICPYTCMPLTIFGIPIYIFFFLSYFFFVKTKSKCVSRYKWKLTFLSSSFSNIHYVNIHLTHHKKIYHEVYNIFIFFIFFKTKKEWERSEVK